MRSRLRLIRGSRGEQNGARRLNRGLPPHLEEDVRLVGALAELFAVVAAERLADEEAASGTRQPTLPLIALATGAALCAPLLESPPAARRYNPSALGTRGSRHQRRRNYS